MGQVTDGTKCGNQKMCMNRTCIDMQQYATYTRCPVDANNVECSGQGICSNINTCVCDLGLGGNDCSKKVPTITPFIDPNNKKVTTPTPDASQTDSNTYIRKWHFLLMFCPILILQMTTLQVTVRILPGQEAARGLRTRRKCVMVPRMNRTQWAWWSF